MIKFSKIRYKNFLATGNAFTEIQLDAHPTTLIVGKNGDGKSTVIEAITFALFGRPFRNINKSQLLNSINGKQCVVELEFSIGSKQYRVVRGIKPNLFEIYINGELENQTAAMKDYQEYLEDVILKLNFKSFTQIVILGSASFVPFMQLPAGTRREIIEDILDIKIFTSMNAVLKTKLSSAKDNLTQVENNLTLAKQKATIQHDYIQTLQEDREQRINEITKKIAEQDTQIEEAELVDLEKMRDTWLADIVDAANTRNALALAIRKQEKSIEDAVRAREDYIKEDGRKRAEALKEDARMRAEIKRQDAEFRSAVAKEEDRRVADITKQINEVKAEIQFYHTNDSCPTCKQNISDAFKLETVSEKADRLAVLMLEVAWNPAEIPALELPPEMVVDPPHEPPPVSTEIVETEEMIGYRARIRDIGEIEKKFDAIQLQITEYEIKIKSSQKIVRNLQDELTSLQSKKGNLDTEKAKLKEMAKEVVALADARAVTHEEKQYLDIAATLLKDSGIKTTIIRQYIGTINKLVNKYLQAMDFFVSFELDDEFKEVIKSRHRDDFSYESFSEGEKQKIDLALTFTWRTIAKMKNSTSTNLFILDEVFDSSLDAEATENVINLLKTMDEQSHIWVISHKGGDTLLDRFSHIIRFEKRNNFSVIQ